MHQFVEACIRQNIPFVNELHVCVRLKLSAVMIKLGHWINFFFVGVIIKRLLSLLGVVD